MPVILVFEPTRRHRLRDLMNTMSQTQQAKETTPARNAFIQQHPGSGFAGPKVCPPFRGVTRSGAGG
ncbi:MAG: hypothetical protein Q8K14_14570, partial [Hydrogenophaga sp.]|nr:hypothetical protein [Hydrogenophaga sp.]